MGCGCKGKTANASVARAAASRAETRVHYEVFGGSLTEPATFAALSDARTHAAAHGARVRSTVVREPVAVDQ